MLLNRKAPICRPKTATVQSILEQFQNNVLCDKKISFFVSSGRIPCSKPYQIIFYKNPYDTHVKHVP
jgi:hypothetical protein